MFLTAIGQDSHRFEPEGSTKPLLLGGVHIPNCPGLMGNSDADVVLHSITNAVSGISCVNILGKISDDLCKNQGITDSKVYLEKALETLISSKILHISISIEACRPHLSDCIMSMRKKISELTGVSSDHIGITATSGEGLTEFGRGEGIQVFTIITVETI